MSLLTLRLLGQRKEKRVELWLVVIVLSPMVAREHQCSQQTPASPTSCLTFPQKKLAAISATQNKNIQFFSKSKYGSTNLVSI